MKEITRSPLCYPNNIARTPPHDRRRARFDERSISFAAGAVVAEINRLNGRHWNYSDESVIISSNLKLKQDGLPMGNQMEPSDTGVAVYFNLRFKRNGKYFERHCVLSCDRWTKTAENLIAIAKDIAAQRSRERWGCTSIEQAFQGYLAIPERCGGAPWWVTLGVTSTATKSEIEAAYKAKVKTVHPDMGGSAVQFNVISEAYQQATAQFRG